MVKYLDLKPNERFAEDYETVVQHHNSLPEVIEPSSFQTQEEAVITVMLNTEEGRIMLAESLCEAFRLREV